MSAIGVVGVTAACSHVGYSLGSTENVKVPLRGAGRPTVAGQVSPPPSGAPRCHFVAAESGGSMAFRDNAGDAKRRSGSKAVRKRRSRPRWGRILGRKSMTKSICQSLNDAIAPARTPVRIVNAILALDIDSAQRYQASAPRLALVSANGEWTEARQTAHR